MGGKSGHLHLALSGERKSLRILRGQIVHGTSDAAGEHMGDVLVRYGLLSQTDLERAVAIVLRERRRLGAVLGELGLLERSRIEEAVGLHAREILFSVLGRTDVSCTFEELAESLLETDLVCPLSTGQLILEATRRVLDPELVRMVLGDMGRVLTLSSDPLLRSQRITLTPADGFVLSRVDGSLTARDVIGLVPLPVEDAERSLFSLLCTGIVDYRQEANPTLGPPSGRRRSTPPPPAPAPTPPPVAPGAPRRGTCGACGRWPSRPRRAPGGRASATGGTQRRGDPLPDPGDARQAQARPLRGDGSRAHGHRGRGARGLRWLRACPAPGRVPASCLGGFAGEEGGRLHPAVRGVRDVAQSGVAGGLRARLRALEAAVLQAGADAARLPRGAACSGDALLARSAASRPYPHRRRPARPGPRSRGPASRRPMRSHLRSTRG